uniref:Uncharacterized protein n=1 Tax=Sphaerodactylus townsendi TaxID=933632 RepID=A0ACB8ED73_9SAUR
MRYLALCFLHLPCLYPCGSFHSLCRGFCSALSPEVGPVLGARAGEQSDREGLPPPVPSVRLSREPRGQRELGVALEVPEAGNGASGQRRESVAEIPSHPSEQSPPAKVLGNAAPIARYDAPQNNAAPDKRLKKFWWLRHRELVAVTPFYLPSWPPLARDSHRKTSSDTARAVPRFATGGSRTFGPVANLGIAVLVMKKKGRIY